MPSVNGRAFQVAAPGGPFELVQREYPEPGPGHVRIRVQACGVCHSDSITKYGVFPGIAYPRVPGHEVAGVIDAIGADVAVFKTGQRVGLGWHGGHCNYCNPCRRGDFILCENQKISGISYDGGYADYVIAPANALALIPDDLTDVDAAPLMCAGVTTFNSLRHSGARPGDLVAITRWPSHVAKTRAYSRRSWERITTLTAQSRTSPRSCRSWAEQRSSSRR